MGNQLTAHSKRRKTSTKSQERAQEVSNEPPKEKEPTLERIHTVGSILNPKLLGEALYKAGSQFSNARADVPEFLQKLAMVLRKKTYEEDGLKGISCHVFKKYLCGCCEEWGEVLYNYFVSRVDDNFDGPMLARKTLTVDEFMEQANIILNTFSDDQQTRYYTEVYSKDGKVSKTEFQSLVFASYAVAQFVNKNQSDTVDDDDDLLMAIIKSAMKDKDSYSIKYVSKFIHENCPRMVTWMHKYIVHHLTVGYSTIPQNTHYNEGDSVTPTIKEPKNNSLCKTHSALVWMLTCVLPDLYIRDVNPRTPSPEAKPMEYIYMMVHGANHGPNHWVVLYNSNDDGISINRFQHHVFDYQGPTLVFLTGRVAETDWKEIEYMFCIASDEPWRDSIHFFGQECMLIELLPRFKVIERGPKMMYLNLSSRGFPFGFNIGLDKKDAPLVIDAQLEKADFRHGITMDLVRVEVWGCGNRVAHAQQKEMKKIHMRDVEARRKVNLDPGDWRNNPDRLLVEMAGKVCVNNSENNR